MKSCVLISLFLILGLSSQSQVREYWGLSADYAPPVKVGLDVDLFSLFRFPAYEYEGIGVIYSDSALDITVSEGLGLYSTFSTFILYYGGEYQWSSLIHDGKYSHINRLGLTIGAIRPIVKGGALFRVEFAWRLSFEEHFKYAYHGPRAKLGLMFPIRLKE